MMTIWWANQLKSKDDLHIGQVLTIPPVTGLVVTVKATDTLDSIADRYKRRRGRHPRPTNGLDDPNLVIGQVARRPGRRGQGHPDAEAAQGRQDRPPRRARHQRRRRRRHVSPPRHYNGGRFGWPVVGGGNYISQYFHYGHYGARHRRRLRLAACARRPAGR